ncbi:MAG: M48 family metallopeptidase [Magnetococcales bacterium]|nr:M48 family metallopeptidase [Magnetococcales bacterium]
MGGVVTAAGSGVVTWQGETISYLLVRMRSRKRMSLRVDEQGVLQVRVPWRVTVGQAEQFVGEHAPWILQQLQMRQTRTGKPALQEGGMLPFLDGFLHLHYGTEQIRPLFREGDRLWVAERYRTLPTLTDLLEQWYRRQAHPYLSARLETWSTLMGVPFVRLTVRSQKSRWGSCSARKTISLNWRLMCLPTRLGDYVLVHELCHLRHMNHSPEFWAMVARFVPDYLTCRRQLRLFSSPW